MLQEADIDRRRDQGVSRRRRAYGLDEQDRGAEEIVTLRGTRLAPEGTDAVNPAFDVTPHDLITAIVTDKRVIRP